jgi:hypothetical protein
VKARWRIALAIAVLSSTAFAISSPGADHVFLFASSNTREFPSDRDAQARLNSFGQRNATVVADRAACALTADVGLANSLGIYDNSAENSFILEADLAEKQSKYLAALMGLYLRQEFVLLFFDQASGADRLWIIKTRQSLTMIVAAVRKLKLTPVTVRMRNDQNEVWFVDIGEKRAGTLNILTSDVNGRASVTAGVAELLGNQSRTTALEEWRQQIAAFERRSSPQLSGQLTSKGWRGATAVHTCSREMAIP